MNFKNITVTDISNIITVYSEKGCFESINNRKTYGLSLCIDGQITYFHKGREYVSDKSCAVILPKGETYSLRRDKTGYFPVINFDCLEFLCDTVTVIPIQSREQMIVDYERMKRLFYFEENRAQIFSIFYGMLHNLFADNIPRELQRAVSLIKKEYSDTSLTNARLAEECNISEVYFRKLFTKHFGSSPKQFVIDLRIQKAKQMLLERKHSVLSISEQCGFSNQYHFCRTFKHHTGITPSEYRKTAAREVH